MSRGEGKNRTQLRKEINIAIFWRERIGDFEYIKFEPDDVLRWHLAMDLRGRDEVAELMRERYAVYTRKTPILGLVGEVPHPPAWIVHEWLNAQEPVTSTKRVIYVAGGLLLCIATFVPLLHGCQDLQTGNTLAYRPPNSLPSLAQGAQPASGVPAAGDQNAVRDATGTTQNTAGSRGAVVRTAPTNSGLSSGTRPP